MRPNVYLSKSFLQKIDECEPVFRSNRGNPETGEFIPAELKALERIVVLLLHGNLLTDYDEKEAVKLFKKASIANGCNTFSELILKQAIKQNRFQHSVGAFARYRNENGSIDLARLAQSTLHKNATYFLPEKHDSCICAGQKADWLLLAQTSISQIFLWLVPCLIMLRHMNWKP